MPGGATWEQFERALLLPGLSTALLQQRVQVLELCFVQHGCGPAAEGSNTRAQRAAGLFSCLVVL